MRAWHSLTFAIFILGFHFATPSIFNASKPLHRLQAGQREAAISETVNLHEQWGPFAKRPLVTSLVRSIEARLSVEVTTAFILAVFFQLLIVAWALTYATKKITSDPLPVLSLLPFAASFTILFAFFAPIYSYDELIQYTFIFLALACLKEQPRAAALLLCLAGIARETTLLTLPGFSLLALGRWTNVSRRDAIKAAMVFLFPAIFMYAYNRFFPFPDMSTRFDHWKFNFQDTRHTVETFISFFLAIVPVFFLAFLSNWKKTSISNSYISAFWLTLLINTPIVLVASLARESRLFALPLVFLWPMAGRWLFEALVRTRVFIYREPLRATLVAVISLSVGKIVHLLAKRFYIATLNGYYDGYRVYLAIFCAIACAWILATFQQRTCRADVSPGSLLGVAGERRQRG